MRKKNHSGIYEWAQRYLNYYGKDITFELIRTAYASVANIVIIPMQDILNLGFRCKNEFSGETWW